MAREKCVFCGNEVGYVRCDWLSCGPVSQLACKDCIRELKDLSEVEKCRRALQRGLAISKEKLEEYIAMVDSAEESRPVCPSCGGKMTFRKIVTLEKRYDVFDPLFEIVPACCESCGRLALFDPAFIRRSKPLTYLAEKDTGASV